MGYLGVQAVYGFTKGKVGYDVKRCVVYRVWSEMFDVSRVNLLLTIPVHYIHIFASRGVLRHALNEKINVALYERLLLTERLFAECIGKVATHA